LRSEREIRDYARRKQWTEDNTERVIDRLCERGYLNDERFAESFVRSRANTRNFSAKRMKVELQKKGVKPDIITNILAELDDYDEMAALRKMIAKKINKYDDERKLVAYLARQGFKYDDIKSALVDDEN
jgi:regulatory protein